MPDIAAITGVISSLKSATELAKLIKDSHQSLADAEVKLKLADLISSLADARVEMSDLQNVLIAKEQEIADLKSKLEFRDELVWEDPLYWVERDGKKDGPYCQPCYDGGGKLHRLSKEEQGVWHCQVCDKRFTDDDWSGPTSLNFEPDFV